MTVQELYDQLSDEELKESLTNENSFKTLKEKHKQLFDKTINSFNVELILYKQAATRWLKNQSK